MVADCRVLTLLLCQERLAHQVCLLAAKCLALSWKLSDIVWNNK